MNKNEPNIIKTNNITTIQIQKKVKVPKINTNLIQSNSGVNNVLLVTNEVTDKETSKSKSKTVDKDKYNKTMEDESVIKNRIKSKYLIKEKEKEVELIDIEIKNARERARKEMKEMETEKIEIRDKQIEEFYKDKKLKNKNDRIKINKIL